jgi:hypothetical protein
MFRRCTILSNTSLTRKRGERGWTCRTRMAAFSALAGQRPLSSLARQASVFSPIRRCFQA